MNERAAHSRPPGIPGIAPPYRRTGDMMMLAGAAVAVLAALVAYPYAHDFPMGAQIVAHLLIPLGAAAFKLGYVVRLAAQEARRQRGMAGPEASAVASAVAPCVGAS